MVELFHQGRHRSVPTKAQTVADFLNRLEIEPHPQDLVEPSLATEIDSDNFQINIYLASPIVIVDGDYRRLVLSPHRNPRLVVQKAGYELAPKDEVNWGVEEFDNLTLARTIVIKRHGTYKLVLNGQPRWIDAHSKPCV